MDKKDKVQACDSGRGKGAIYVVGTGPGAESDLTDRARTAIASADVVVGYTTYVDLIRGLIKDKEIFETPMRGEVERCKKAIELARSGRRVAVVSGGDAGIYAMAGLVLELLSNDARGELPRVEVVPGLPAFVSAAALLGAPLMHDFASISLSDLLTPWEDIIKRLHSAASTDFVLILYNPKSRARTTQLAEALAVIKAYRAPEAPIGIVRNASRTDSQTTVTTLGLMDGHIDGVDMSTILIVGNSKSFISEIAGERVIITPRGYDTR